jgi:hypothetical protein
MFRRISLRPSKQTPGTLYHYTSAAGFVGIVRDGTLRAGNFAYLNDAAEIHYGRQLVLSAIQSHMSARPPQAVARLLLRVQRTLDDIGKGLEFYLACFCKKPDLLSQWRGYGSGRGRYCIGFDTDRLPPVWQVIYDADEQGAQISRTIGAATAAARVGTGVEFTDELHDALTRQLVRTLSCLKHPGFSEEREWRVVHQARGADKVECDASTGVLRPYVRLIGRGGIHRPRARLPIVEVQVGPSPMASQSVTAVERFLIQHHHTRVRVSATALTYREL